ncbi:hypothetical protein C2E20_5660 [Micractinium conductrix]|uniref:Uncharacterized protein n=1 Tax=Micractinium conductrix TaxID=554055 RepID=A0A2P6V9T4_9CHLO|nr:hypothetical protein C2E20_5660 [Micractinium conductrix]|eukprot:PSC70852.1 hypothetical protein C2E20_5660 [Micractinium conductrix]
MRRQRPLGAGRNGSTRGSALDGRSGSRLLPDSHVELQAPRAAPGGRCASYMPMNADPRLLPERTGAYVRVPQRGSAASAATAAPQLGAALSQGYGRAPTAFVYTSADTLLATMSLQSPGAHRLAGGAGGLQAFAFSHGGSASAPASPMGRRTMLYTRAAHDPASAHHLPAPDLLDRLTCCAAWRPPPRRRRARRSSPPRLWAWDDSVLGAHGAAAARPIAAVPAPGWRYCGDVTAAAAPMPGQPGVTAIAASFGGGRRPGSGGGMALGLGLAVSGAEQEGAAEQEADMVLVVRSSRPHQLHAEDAAAEAAEAAEEAAAGEAARRAGSRAAFRPPGPLRHKFGNKAQPPRPRSAPASDAERARAAVLRDCGCPHTPRRPAPSSLQAAWEEQRAVRQSARPHSAPRSPHQQQCDDAVEAARLAALHLARRSSSVGAAPSSAGAAAATHAMSVAAGDAEVVVVSSPQAMCIGCRSGQDQQDVVVVATSPRARRSKGRPGSADVGGDLLVVCCSPPASPRKQAALGMCRQDDAATAAAAAAVDPQQRGSRTKLSVTVPGAVGSYSIRADASAKGGAAAGSSACVSPIKAWRQPDAVQPAAAAAPPAPPAWQPQQQAQAPTVSADAADLQRLECEIQRRECSFAGLLADLERISANMSGQAAACGSRAASAGQSKGVASKPASGKAAAGGGSKEEAGDWGWEALLAFEEKIREQQRKLVEQGVLPREYA